MSTPHAVIVRRMWLACPDIARALEDAPRANRQVERSTGEFPAQQTSTEPFSAFVHTHSLFYVFGKEGQLILKE